MISAYVGSGVENAEEDASMPSVKSSRRGRPRILPKWSRIICFEDIDDYEVTEYDIEEDIKALEEKPLKTPRSRGKHWALLFEQKQYWKDLEQRDIDSRRLDEEARTLLTEKIISFRKLFVKRAQAALWSFHRGSKLEVEDIERLADKLQNRGSGKKTDPNEIQPSEYKEIVPIDCRKKGGSRGKLSLSSKIDIVQNVLVFHTPTKEVAKKHRISECYVTNLCSRAKKKPEFLRELY